MWQKARVAVERLQDLDALEKELGGRIMNVRHLSEEEAEVEYAPVVDDSWFVEVWQGHAELYIIDENGFIVPAVQKYEVDADKLAAVVSRVLEDYGIDTSATGQYYPISEAAQAAFQALVQEAKAKRRPFARR